MIRTPLQEFTLSLLVCLLKLQAHLTHQHILYQEHLVVVLQTPTKANKCILMKGAIQNHEDSLGVSYRRCTEDLPSQYPTMSI